MDRRSMRAVEGLVTVALPQVGEQSEEVHDVTRVDSTLACLRRMPSVIPPQPVESIDSSQVRPLLDCDDYVLICVSQMLRL